MLIIKNGLFFDGTGAEASVRHLAIDGGVVAKISSEPLDEEGAERVIDAAGKWVMPGFLDTHTHYDAELLASPGLTESVRHGVTTVCMGSCSLSTVVSSVDDCADIFARVEALPHKHVADALREYKTWNTPQGYIDGIEARPLGPNVAVFLGHSDVRAKVMGLGRAVDPDTRPSSSELVEMEDLLREALDAGFLGLSTMTNPWDKVGGERYRSARLPSTYATWSEYRRFHAILRDRERILQSAPNITTKLNVLVFMAESASFGMRKPLKTTLITCADAKSTPEVADLVMVGSAFVNDKLGANLRWQTVPMPFEVYADGMDLVVFEEFGAGEAALHFADALERNELLKDEDYRRRFRKDYDRKWSPRVWQRDFNDAEIVAAPDETLVGRSFGDVASDRQIHPVDAFLDLVVEHGEKLRWRTTIANHRPDKLKQIVAHPAVHVSFADSGAHVRNMAFYNFALYFLRTVVRAEAEGKPLMPIEQAVWKVTGELGEWYGIDAGRLRVGDRADITIIDPAALDDSLDGYHEAPMDMFGGLSRMVRRNDDAVPFTMIAGEVVWDNGAFVAGYGEQRRYGSFLRAGEVTAPYQHGMDVSEQRPATGGSCSKMAASSAAAE